MEGIDFLGYIVIIGFLVIIAVVYISKDESFQLKCIVSTVDGNKYCVRERGMIQAAADRLAEVSQKCKTLVEYMKEKYPEDDRTKRLNERFDIKKINEILPTSVHTAYSENKEKISLCLSSKDKKDNNNIIDEHTLTFVALHEMSHIATESVGHGQTFWSNFQFILKVAKEAGIHEPADYKKKPQEYCGMKIHDNPYYDA